MDPTMEKSPQYTPPQGPPPAQQQQQQFQPQQQQYQQQQPMMQNPMMPYHPNPLNKEIDPKSGKRDWSHSLCSCCDIPSTCCLSWCCPCISYGKTKQIYAQRKDNLLPEEPAFCGSDAIIWYAVQMVFCGCLMDCSLRGEMRNRYNIKGNSCTDCLATSCCHVCVQVQHRQEVNEEQADWVARNQQNTGRV